MPSLHPRRRLYAGRLALILSLGFASPLLAEVEFYEDFESYDEGDPITGQGGWEPWDLAATDAFGSNEVAFSGETSIRVEPSTDIVQVFRDYFDGQWTVRGYMYYPSPATGEAFFLLLNQYEHNGAKNWSTQVVVRPDGVESSGGTGFGRGATLPTVFDRWVEIRVDIDLDASTQTIYYDGKVLDETHQWQASGLNEFQCIDIYSSTADGVFYDDIVVHSTCEFGVEADPTSGTAPLSVAFSSSEDACEDEPFDTIEWDFGDGSQGEGLQVTHEYVDAGVFTVTMLARDGDGIPYSASGEVSVGCGSEPPAPWSFDIIGAGEPYWPGCATDSDGCLDVVGSGTGFTSRSDDVVFAHVPIAGDFSLSARISDVDWQTQGIVGIFARASLDPDSGLVGAALINGGTEPRPATVRRRPGSSVVIRTSTSVSAAFPDVWVRLDRVANVFTTYVSEDGAAWEMLREEEVELPATVECGLSVNGGPRESIGSASFCDTSGFEPSKGGDTTFQRGDTDGSGSLGLNDAVNLFLFLFQGGEAPGCSDAADSDDNGRLELTDGVRTLQFLFLGGDAPPAPQGACGADPTDDELDCAEFPACAP